MQGVNVPAPLHALLVIIDSFSGVDTLITHVLTLSGKSLVASISSETSCHKSSGEEMPPGYLQAIEMIAMGSDLLFLISGCSSWGDSGISSSESLL
jgi:hypothetical protein